MKNSHEQQTGRARKNDNIVYNKPCTIQYLRKYQDNDTCHDTQNVSRYGRKSLERDIHQDCLQEIESTAEIVSLNPEKN